MYKILALDPRKKLLIHVMLDMTMMKISLEDAYMRFPHVYFLGSLKDATAGLILRFPPKEFSCLILLVPLWSPRFT